ncbi:MAG: hypothetical protein KDF65_02675, partial [Anaerolineae bacterium]|nr:hypothetical protein [Anaerolineae bacterium]
INEPWKPGAEGQEATIRWTKLDNSEELIVTPPMSPYLTEVEAMEACVLDGAEPVVPLSLSRDFLRTLLALYQSAETGRTVTL